MRCKFDSKGQLIIWPETEQDKIDIDKWMSLDDPLDVIVDMNMSDVSNVSHRCDKVADGAV
jgi:hypothetical protein